MYHTLKNCLFSKTRHLDEVYLILSSDDQFQAMCDTLQQKFKYSDPPQMPQHWEKGQACAAFYDKDGSWHRASVLDIQPDKVQVSQYVIAQYSRGISTQRSLWNQGMRKRLACVPCLFSLSCMANRVNMIIYRGCCLRVSEVKNSTSCPVCKLVMHEGDLKKKLKQTVNLMEPYFL